MMSVTQPRRLADMTGLTRLSETTTCQDPQAAYQRLRAAWGQVAPVELEPGIPAWLVMGHQEICEVVRSERLFSRNPHNWRLLADGVVPADSGLGPMMFPRDNAYFADGEKHRRLRSPLDTGLAALDKRRMSRMIRATCEELIDQFAGLGKADLVAEYAAVVPMQAVIGFFGIEPDQARELRKNLIALFGSGEDSQAGYLTIQQILTDTIQAHRAAPGDDLTTAFLADSHLDSDDEIMQSMLLMIAAGQETTQTWIAQTLRLMLTDPRFAGQVRGGRLGVDDALDEVLWRDPPMANMPARYALNDTELGGQAIQRGDALILGFAAANNDARVHTDDPWLEIGNRAHLAWSAGPHSCPAQRAGRLIARTAVDRALHRLPEVRLAIPAGEIDPLPSPWTRCPAQLPVHFTPERPVNRS